MIFDPIKIAEKFREHFQRKIFLNRLEKKSWKDIFEKYLKKSQKNKRFSKIFSMMWCL